MANPDKCTHANPFHLTSLDQETPLVGLILILIPLGWADDQRRILCPFCSGSQDSQIKGKEVQELLFPREVKKLKPNMSWA